MWSLMTSQPVFSSPCVWLPSLASQVNRSISETVSTCQSPGMDSDISTSSRTRVVFGSHDHRVYCLATDGSLVWSFETDSPVYSSPCVAQLNYGTNTSGFTNALSATTQVDVDCSSDKSTQNNTMHPLNYGSHYDSCNSSTRNIDCRTAVIACSTKGTVFVLSLDNGNVIAKLQLPGEVFSSPVVYRGCIYVGCRDNNLYCLRFMS